MSVRFATANVSFNAITPASYKYVAPTKVGVTSTAHSSHELDHLVVEKAGGFRYAQNMDGPQGDGFDPDFPADYLYEGHLRTFTSGDDMIDNLGSGSDAVYAGQGNDRIYGGGGKDYLFGGAGDDDIVGGLRGNQDMDTVGDTIVAGSGNDHVEGGRGNDMIHAGSNTGDFNGTNQATAIYDYINGNAGNDLIYLDGWDGGAITAKGGTYLANGGTGNDSFIVGNIVYANITGGYNDDSYNGLDTDSFIFKADFHGKADIQGFQDHEFITIDGEMSGHHHNASGDVVITLVGQGAITVEGYTWSQIQDQLTFL